MATTANMATTAANMDTAANKGACEPFPSVPSEFLSDPRIYFDKVSQAHKLEDENDKEWEWSIRLHTWIPVEDDALIEQQQRAYQVAGVDEDEPAQAPRKRKAGDAGEGGANGKAKKQKSEEKLNRAVYISSLPDDVTVEELYEVFSKFGVIAESAEHDQARIKLYHDENGNFKGDALVVYFRPESVQLAINMLDETDFRLGKPVATGPMRVTEADLSFKAQKDQPLASEQAKKKGTGANRNRLKVIKKNQEMNSRLADWDDDEPSTLPDTSSRWDKMLVLKHMFTLAELEEEPASLLEIINDVRDECEKIGDVTKVILYDKEEDGVVTVRFSEARFAKSSIKVFDGRIFNGRNVVAYVADGKEKFKKSSNKDNDADEEEEKRLEKFGKFIDGEEE